jgi:hypothetical protein
MRFPLRSLFAATTCIAMVTVAIGFGQRGWLAGFWLMLLAAVLLLHMRLQIPKE